MADDKRALLQDMPQRSRSDSFAGASPVGQGGRHPLIPALRGLEQPTLVVLIGLLVLRTVLLFTADTVAWALLRIADPTAPWSRSLEWANVSVVVVDVITIVVVAVALRRGGASLGRLLRTRTPLRDLGWGLLLALIAVAGFLIASYIGNIMTYQGAPPLGESTWSPPLWLGVWSITIMPLTIAVAEEVLYRGYLQHLLSARFGTVAGLLLMALGFSLQHLALTTPDAAAWTARAITTFLAGIMFGALVLWKRRLWPVIIAHWLLDVALLGLPVLMLSMGNG